MTGHAEFVSASLKIPKQVRDDLWDQMKKITFIFVLLSFLTRAGNPPAIIFKENKGQWPDKVLFGSQFHNAQFYVNKTGFNYCIYDLSDVNKGHNRLVNPASETDHNESVIHAHNYQVDFTCGEFSSAKKLDERKEYYNYFLGNDRSKWKKHVKAYQSLLFENVYAGIDVKLYSDKSNLKYDIIVKPGGNASLIKLNYKFIDGIAVKNNEVIIKLSTGNVIENRPYAYQIINGIKTEVECKYVLSGKNTIGFAFPESYDKNFELIIDPTVIVCSYSAYNYWGAGSAATCDSKGNIYNTGYSFQNYPTTLGAFSSTYQGYWDINLTAYDPTGSSQYFATYLGGDSSDFVICPIVTEKEIILAGSTYSKNYPFSKTAFDTTFNGFSDLFVSKLSLDGDSLYASTYIGGIFNDGIGVNIPQTYFFDLPHILESRCDSSGNIFMISATTSTNFPVTAGAISNTKQGFVDAMVFKLNSNLSNLLWSTYLGGNGIEAGNAIRLDGTGGIYCLGSTTSSNFPVTTGVISQTKSGAFTASDMYVTHLSSTGSLLASTYIGTPGSDYGCFMDMDMNGDLYLAGQITATGQFTATPGVYSNPSGYNTIYKINSSLTNIILKTKFGYQPPPISPAPLPHLIYSAFKVDSCKNIYAVGTAYDMFPTTSNKFQSFAGGITDLYIAVFGPDCSYLKLGSYYGGPRNYWNLGEHCDGGVNTITDKGVLYHSVCSAGGLPTTPGAFNPTFLAGTDSFYNDAFIKIDLGTFVNATSYGANITGCPPFTPTFVSTTNTGTTYWDFGNGFTSTRDTVSTTYTNLGNYNVLLLVTDTSTCNKYDSIKSILSVISPTAFELGDEVMTCLTVPVYIQSNVSAVTYSWSTGETTPNIYATPGTYTLTINNGGCNSSDVINVVVGELPLSERFPNVVTANGDNINDFIDLKKYNFQEIELFIYDRWGREIYSTNDPIAEWHPENLNSGTYYYVANYRSSCIGKFATDKGFISLFK